MNQTTMAVQRTREPAAVQPATAKPEKPLDRMNLIFEDIARRAFEIFEGNGREFGHDLDNWFKAERELLCPVNIEFTENDAAFEVKAEVPGFTEKDLEINVEPRKLVIAGRRETKAPEDKNAKVARAETMTEELLRVVELPAAVETGKVTATLLKNGILALNLPKAVPARPVRIQPAAS